MNLPVRVRFAPSPTGHLHIGGARTALFNYLFARRHGGVFILRLEDTDAERSTEESVRMILSDLRWLGLDWDEGPGQGGEYGPYRQTERLAVYREYADRLRQSGHVYPCFCSAELLETKRQQAQAQGMTYKYDRTCRGIPAEQAQARIRAGEPHTLRVKIPDAGATLIRDLIRGKVVFENDVLDDFIAVRTSGLPTYNFAAVVDDAQMKITHVIRGDDHLSNTPRQILLYQALGEPLPEFAHVPMILGPDKTRLSKRHGATSVGAYALEGYLPEALLNYLALLGWAWDDKTTIFSLPELIEKFSLEKVSKNPAVFDPAKLQWMNGVYIRNLPEEEYIQRALAELERVGALASSSALAERGLATRAAHLVRQNLRRLSELEPAVRFFFGETVEIEPKALEKLRLAQAQPELFKTLHAQLGMLESFTHQGLEEVFKGLMDQYQLKFGDLVHPLRAAVTGRVNSPGIFEVLEVIGRDRTLRRLAQGLALAGIQV